MQDKIDSKKLFELVYSINISTDLELILNKIIEKESLRFLSSKRATIYFIDEENEWLIPKATLDSLDGEQSMKESIPIKSSLSGKVLKSKKGMIFNDAKNNPNAYHIPGTSDEKNENLIVVPIIIVDKVLGTINLYRDDIPYSNKELEIANIFGMYVSIAVQNTLTNQQLKNEIQERKFKEKNFQTFFNDSLVGAFISTPEGRLIDCNQALVDLLKYPDKKTALLTSAYSVYQKKSDRDNKIKLLRKHKKLIQLEEEILRHDGEKIIVVSNVWGEYNEKGELLFVQGFTQDITERKKIEYDLKHSEENFRLLTRDLQFVNNVYSQTSHLIDLDEISKVVADSIRQYVGECVVAVSGYDDNLKMIRIKAISGLEKRYGTVVNALGKDPNQLVFDSTKLSKIYKIFASRKLIKVEGGLAEILSGQVSKSKCQAAEKIMGVKSVFTASFSNDRNAKGGIIIFIQNTNNLVNTEPIELVIGYIAELIKNKLVVNEIERNKEKFRNVIEHSIQMFYIHDNNHILSYVSPQCVELFGYTPEEMMVNWTTLVTDNPINEKGVKITTKTLKTGKKQPPYYLEIQRKDKQKRMVKVFESPLKDNDGKVVGLAGSLEDVTDMIAFENKLKESEERFQFAVEGNDLGLWDWNTKTNEVYFSPQWKKMLGFKENEITGSLEEWDKRVHPDDKERVYKDINKHLDGKTSIYVNEHRVQCKDKSYKWILDRGKLITRTKDGKPLRMIGTHTDISEQKIAEKKLIRSEERFRLVSETANDLIYEWNIENDKLDWFGDIDKALGYESGKFPRTLKAWVSRIHPDDLAVVENAIKKQRKTKGKVYIEYRIKRKDGSWRYWTDAGLVINDESGKPIKQVGACTDITDDKKREMEIILQNERLELFATIFENLNECITVTDKDHKIFYVNKAFKKLYGYGEDEYLGKTVDFLRIDNDPALLKTIKKSTNDGGWSGEIINRKKDGTIFPIELSTTRIFDTGKNVVARIGIVKDITDRKKIEQELQEHRDRLEELVDERTKKLEKANSELDNNIKLFVGREMKIVELRNKVKELEREIKKLNN